MSVPENVGRARDLPRFDRSSRLSPNTICSLGGGFIGGKATGLTVARRILDETFPEGERGGVRVEVPAFVVLGTDVFDSFVRENQLEDAAGPERSDDRIAHAFLRASLPSELVGDLRALAQALHTPLAVRSSSLLEDATGEPFAGVYATKMTPNQKPDADTRFARMSEAIRFVLASTFFKEARGYRSLTGRSDADEKMAVIIQQVVGRRHADRFYPTVSGVARSFNHYPTGKAQPEDGLIELALGLGRTIVDGDGGWAYSPAFPKVRPPLSTRELLKDTQTRFWAVNMGTPPSFDPLRESEYLQEWDLAAAELDGSLTQLASTYDAPNDRLLPGTGRPGPRVLDFAPLLTFGELPLTQIVSDLLHAAEDHTGAGVELEFALTIDPLKRDAPTFGLLQVRSIVVARDEVALEPADLLGENVLLASEKVLGHGVTKGVQHVLYVRPEVFETRFTQRIARQIETLNSRLREQGERALLLVFGRLGSRDPWLGIPADWGQISQAAAIAEATRPELDVDLSQGSHFFHNMTSLSIPYFHVHHASPHGIRWALLDALPAVEETEFARLVRLDAPLEILVDGRSRRGVIRT